MKDNPTVKGQIIKGVGGKYTVVTESGAVECASRGKLRMDGDIYIGDYAEIELFKNGKGAICSVLPRNNNLVRPYVANIDSILVCVAPVPKPDFLLVDKLLIGCIKDNIDAVIVVNKSDIADGDFLASVRRDYDGLADIAEVSAVSGDGLDRLYGLIKGKFVALSGQSAVGKSSLINKLCDMDLEVGELSRKTMRGKHTTRYVEVYDVGNGTRIADTCGFSVLELPLMRPDELSEYFLDFTKISEQCRFKGCNHIDEPDCAVKRAVAEGRLSADRYDRYVKLYKDLSERWRKRYE